MDDLVAKVRAGLDADEEYARRPALWKEYVRGYPNDPKRVLAEGHLRLHGDEWTSGRARTTQRPVGHATAAATSGCVGDWSGRPGRGHTESR